MTLGLVVAGLLAACSTARPPTRVSASPPSPSVVAEPEPFRGRVLMINGGGNPHINYRSHLMHLERLHAFLVESGVPIDRISVLASDGRDPAPDLSARDQQPEAEFWRLSGTRVERWLRTPTVRIDSQLPGVMLEAATKENLRRWFERAAGDLGPGDTLFVYVTDHGTRHGNDPRNNRITLWNDESISVRELEELVGELAPEVRVVMLMSQCFSGGFGELGASGADGGGPAGNVCGYFSSTADRPAYGCYAENLGKDNVGHAFEFIDALEKTGRLADAHETVLVRDATPDVPLRTSDVYLESLLTREATAQGSTLADFSDRLLAEAFRDPGRWQDEKRLLDRIGQGSGSFSPRSLAEIATLAERLPEIDRQLTLVESAWRDALTDANASNLDRFIASDRKWAARLADGALQALDPSDARELTGELLPALASYTAQNPTLERRLTTLNRRGNDADAAAYRMQVRLAVVLRMRAILLSIAGRLHVEKSGTPAERQALETLLACEDLSFFRTDTPIEPQPAGDVYPPFEEDLALTRAALPGWLGIRFRDPTPEMRARYDLPQGASLVAAVYPSSPASAAGLEPGDIIVGPPGEPFTSKNQVRAWTMLSEVGVETPLAIVRDGKRSSVSLVPGPFPIELPSLPGPLAVGADAPAVRMTAHRGNVSTAVARQSYLLYFWATWCKPCKAALPELMAFAKARDVPIVAITDEGKPLIETFLKEFSAAFPEVIVSDPFRRAFLAYGVSGTPTFVLIEDGRVARYQIGYTREQGLQFSGWVNPLREPAQDPSN